MHAHPHAHGLGPLVAGQRPLPLDRRHQRVPRAREGVEEAIAGRIDLVALLGGECLAQKPPMIVENALVPIAEVTQQSRRAFDVGEEERYRSPADGRHRTTATSGSRRRAERPSVPEAENDEMTLREIQQPIKE
jgi:hypothetical protein